MWAINIGFLNNSWFKGGKSHGKLKTIYIYLPENEDTAYKNVLVTDIAVLTGPFSSKWIYYKRGQVSNQ